MTSLLQTQLSTALHRLSLLPRFSQPPSPTSSPVMNGTCTDLHYQVPVMNGTCTDLHYQVPVMNGPWGILYSRDSDGYTPLHYAAAADDFILAQSLVFIFSAFGRRDFLNSLDHHGRTPLHWAVDSGSFRIVKLLIENSAAINSQDNDGFAPIHRLILSLSQSNLCSKKLSKIQEIRSYLMSHCDINISDLSGVTALHLASELGDLESIRWLIQFGAWVNVQDHQGENALFYAVRGMQYNVIRSLVEEFDINVEMENEDGESVLDLCRAMGQGCLTDLVKLLYQGKVIHKKMVGLVMDEMKGSDGMRYSGQKSMIIENNSGYIRLSGHSCA